MPNPLDLPNLTVEQLFTWKERYLTQQDKLCRAYKNVGDTKVYQDLMQRLGQVLAEIARRDQLAKGHATFVLDRQADDPQGYSNPVNRALALMITALRKQGVDDWDIYTATTAAMDELDKNKPN